MFPKAMIDEARWLVRRKDHKHPRSAHETKPTNYEPPPGDEDHTPTAWAMRWNVEAIWTAYGAAKSYVERRNMTYEGLTFVLHHGFDRSVWEYRWICFDFDKCISEDGELDEAAAELLAILPPTYVEYSRSRRGLHAFYRVPNCPAFCNITKIKLGGFFLDIFCSNPVAVTGEPFGEFHEVSEITFPQLEGLPFFIFKEPTDLRTETPEWWSEDPLEDVSPEHEYLVPQIGFTPAIQGQGGSKVMYRTACELMRRGIVGREAEALLRTVPQEPPFSPKELQRIVENAYRDVGGDGQFATEGIVHEFEAITKIPDWIPKIKRQEDETDPMERYGFRPIPCEVLDAADLTIEWLAEGAFVAEGALVIGGREKCFKTCIAIDLLISLATLKPFLGQFPITKKRRSVLFTAEIGEQRGQVLMRTVRMAKGVGDEMRGIDYVATVPQFAVDRNGNIKDAKAMKGLKLYFKDKQPEVAVFDPLYLAIGGIAAGDMYAMGDVLNKISTLCKSCNVQPIFCHHAKKDPSKEGLPMELGDFYGSGIGAFARQWMLLSHAQPFRNGIAQLFANVGGSSQGNRGIWDLSVDEGVADDIMDRKWEIAIKKSEVDPSANEGVTEESVLECLRYFDRPVNKKEIIAFTGATGGQLQRIIQRLCKAVRIQIVGDKYALTEGADF